MLLNRASFKKRTTKNSAYMTVWEKITHFVLIRWEKPGQRWSVGSRRKWWRKVTFLSLAGFLRHLSVFMICKVILGWKWLCLHLLVMCRCFTHILTVFVLFSCHCLMHLTHMRSWVVGYLNQSAGLSDWASKFHLSLCMCKTSVLVKNHMQDTNQRWSIWLNF